MTKRFELKLVNVLVVRVTLNTRCYATVIMRCFHLKAWYDLAKNILFFVFLFFYLKAWCNLGIPVKIHTVLVFQIGLKIFSLSKTTIFDVSVSPYRMSQSFCLFFSWSLWPKMCHAIYKVSFFFGKLLEWAKLPFTVMFVGKWDILAVMMFDTLE